MTELGTELKRVYSQGLNIYALINRTKKMMHMDEGWNFPDEVIIGVCKAYEPGLVRNPWAWFVKVLKVESGKWHGEQQVARNDKRTDFAPHVRDVLMGALGKR